MISVTYPTRCTTDRGYQAAVSAILWVSSKPSVRSMSPMMVDT